MSWPLREDLRDPIEEAAIDRMWRAIEARRGPGRRFPLVWLAAAAALVLLAFGGWGLQHALRPQALLTDDGQAFGRLVTPPEASGRQRFADGSTIEAAPGTRVRELASTPQEFSVLLEQGSVDVSVTPGGSRRWIVEAKVARVEVVGTRFRVTRAGDEVWIAVTEGVVVVRSAWLPQGVARLGAGETLHLAPPAPPPPPRSTGAAPAPSSAAPREAADDLMTQADVARVAGDLARAELLLDRLVRELPGDARAPLAAYTLGVVRLQRGRPAPAIEALRLALALHAPSSLQQDCYLRLVEAELASGQRDRALETRRQYELHFPTGRHRRALAGLLGTP